jgi:hypothetical protein
MTVAVVLSGGKVRGQQPRTRMVLVEGWGYDGDPYRAWVRGRSYSRTHGPKSATKHARHWASTQVVAILKREPSAAVLAGLVHTFLGTGRARIAP